ncbi:MAG: nucleoside 2-deoxyribosyltransferase [Tissierellia bacterium]|nr:nucleoside 2-deoxyribosyltransferase [Tissierellia bacterium]
MKAYIASHFFNDAFFTWTENLATEIEKNCDIELYVPQRNDSINDKKNNDENITAEAIAKADTKELKESNILIANLDGLTIDDGVAAEIMAHGVMKQFEEENNIEFPRMIIGILTDMRYQGTGDNHIYRNQMIIGKVQECGKLIIGYPNDKTYIREVIDTVNEFLKENN